MSNDDMKGLITAAAIMFAMQTLAATPTITDADLAAAREQAMKASQAVNASYEASKSKPSQINWDMVPQNSTPTSASMIDQVMQNSSALKAQNGLPTGLLQPQIKGVVFVSFSMPEESIKRYLSQASRINGGKTIKLSIRGLDESNSLIKTQQRISKLMKGKGAEVDIDPGAFDRFNVQSVPALVFYKDDPMGEAKCAVEGKTPADNESDYLMVYGDVSIDYAIDHLLKDKSAKKWQSELTVMRDAVIGKI
jgi:type-F conjugative transfer system pilin assembly protein TrbC